MAAHGRRAARRRTTEVLSEFPGTPQDRWSRRPDDRVVQTTTRPLPPTHERPRHGAALVRVGGHHYGTNGTVGRDRRARLQRGGRPRRVDPPAARLPRPAASRWPGSSRSPTTPAPTGPGASPAAWPHELDGVQAIHLDQKGRGRALRAGVVGAATRRSSPTWTSTSRPTSTRCSRSSPRSCRATATSPSAPAWRRRLAGRARARSARRSPAATTSSCGRRCAAASPTPSAGSRRCAPTSPARCCRWSRTRAGSSTPSCSCSPSTTGCASTRCPSTGSTTPTRGSTWSAPRNADLQGVWRMLRRFARGEVATASRGTRRARGTRPPASASQLVRFASIGVVSTVVFALLFALLAGPLGSARRRRRRARRVLGRQHRRQPAAHVLAARARRARPPLPGRARDRGAARSRSRSSRCSLLEAAGVTSLPAMLAALTAANAVAALARFVLLRRWVFRRPRGEARR